MSAGNISGDCGLLAFTSSDGSELKSARMEVCRLASNIAESPLSGRLGVQLPALDQRLLPPKPDQVSIAADELSVQSDNQTNGNHHFVRRVTRFIGCVGDGKGRPATAHQCLGTIPPQFMLPILSLRVNLAVGNVLV